MKKEKTIRIEVRDINVDDFYFDFKYIVTFDEDNKKEEFYSNDHSWQHDKKSFKEELENGYAIKLAFEEVIEAL